MRKEHARFGLRITHSHMLQDNLEPFPKFNRTFRPEWSTLDSSVFCSDHSQNIRRGFISPD